MLMLMYVLQSSALLQLGKVGQIAGQAASGPGCPWHGLAEYGPPNVKWCEERLCAWINEPANAWSNLAYVLVGVFIYFCPWLFPDLFSNRNGTRATPDGDASSSLRGPLAWFPPTIVAVGVCSFVYHASNTYITQMLDFFGMYLFCFLLILQNAVRLRWLAPERFGVAFIGCVLGLTAFTAVVARFGAPIQGFVSILTLVIVATELLCRRAARAPYSLKAFCISFGLLLAGAACSASDLTRKWCDPGDHFVQGHAAWHVLSALSLLFAYYHYRALPELSAAARPAGANAR